MSIDKGQLLAVIGPSGSGKTSLLRAIAGLDTTSAGTITIDGTDVTKLPTRDRNVAMVFQDSVLYPFMNAERNVAWPLRVRSVPDAEIEQRVHAEGRALDIEHILERWPRELSAGHQQLVQVARAMVRVPSVFLLDEPLARIDAGRRARLRADIRRIQQGYAVTTVYVTNDPVEAMAMADRIAVIDKGRLIQHGSPLEVYKQPDSRFVAELMGERPMNMLAATVRTDRDGSWIVGRGFRLRAWTPSLSAYSGAPVTLGVRPEAIVEDAAGIEVETRRSTTFGSHVEVEMTLGEATVWMRSARPIQPRAIRFEHWHVFDETGSAIAHVAGS